MPELASFSDLKRKVMAKTKFLSFIRRLRSPLRSRSMVPCNDEPDISKLSHSRNASFSTETTTTTESSIGTTTVIAPVAISDDRISMGTDGTSIHSLSGGQVDLIRRSDSASSFNTINSAVFRSSSVLSMAPTDKVTYYKNLASNEESRTEDVLGAIAWFLKNMAEIPVKDQEGIKTLCKTSLKPLSKISPDAKLLLALHEKSISSLKSLHKQSNHHATFELGQHYIQQKDRRKGHRYVKIAAHRGVRGAMWSMGKDALNGTMGLIIAADEGVDSIGDVGRNERVRIKEGLMWLKMCINAPVYPYAVSANEELYLGYYLLGLLYLAGVENVCLQDRGYGLRLLVDGSERGCRKCLIRILRGVLYEEKTFQRLRMTSREALGRIRGLVTRGKDEEGMASLLCGQWFMVQARMAGKSEDKSEGWNENMDLARHYYTLSASQSNAKAELYLTVL